METLLLLGLIVVLVIAWIYLRNRLSEMDQRINALASAVYARSKVVREAARPQAAAEPAAAAPVAEATVAAPPVAAPVVVTPSVVGISVSAPVGVCLGAAPC